MNCPTCQAEMTIMGCRVSDLPFHWCPNCGTLKTCDRDVPFVVPVLIQPRLTEPPNLTRNDIAKEDEARAFMQHAGRAPIRPLRGIPIVLVDRPPCQPTRPLPSTMWDKAAEQARDRAPVTGPGPVTGRGAVMAKLRAEADRADIIEPHTFERSGSPCSGCKECGLSSDHPIHTRGNHGQER